MPDADLLSLETARARILEDVMPLRGGATPLPEARGRVLSADTHALLTLPPWDNSAMDGFAVRSEDVATARPDAPVRLRVIGEVAAGHEPAQTVEPGTAMRVLTGGMIPPGSDTVIKVEDTDAPQGVAALPAVVEVHRGVGPGEHVRRAGSDMQQGDPLLPRGTRIGPAAIAVLAAAGHASVDVHRPARVAIIATGDELTPLGEPLGPAAITDSDGERSPPRSSPRAGNRSASASPETIPETLRERVLEGILAADVLVATGGVSVGAHDVVKDVFEDIGTLDLWRVAIQPGKPLAYGSAPRPDGGHCILFGLPGNPVSSFVTFELFVRPVLRRLRGDAADQGRVRIRATLGEAVTKSPARRAFVRVRLDMGEDGTTTPPTAWLAGGQGSHQLSALATADGLAVIPEGPPGLPAGATVEVIRLDVEIA